MARRHKLYSDDVFGFGLDRMSSRNVYFVILDYRCNIIGVITRNHELRRKLPERWTALLWCCVLLIIMLSKPLFKETKMSGND